MKTTNMRRDLCKFIYFYTNKNHAVTEMIKYKNIGITITNFQKQNL